MYEDDVYDVRPGSTVGHTLEERVEYLLTIARAFIVAPDDEAEPYQEGGMLYDALVCACERLGFDPQAVIDEALGVGDPLGAMWVASRGSSRAAACDAGAARRGDLRRDHALPRRAAGRRRLPRHPARGGAMSNDVDRIRARLASHGDDIAVYEGSDLGWQDGVRVSTCEPERSAVDDLRVLLAALDEAQAALNVMHRRTQRAEAIADRCIDGRPQSGPGLGRALANYTAHRYAQQLAEAREQIAALQRCLGQRAPDEPESYATAVGAAMREAIASERERARREAIEEAAQRVEAMVPDPSDSRLATVRRATDWIAAWVTATAQAVRALR